MKSYIVSGGAVKADGTRYPFHKTVTAPNVNKAREDAEKWLSSKGERPGKPLNVQLRKNSAVTACATGQEKYCGYHQTTHPIEEFGKLARSPDGRAAVCKEANRQIAKNKRDARKEGRDPESLLTQPRGDMVDRFGVRDSVRKINLDGEAYVHVGDLMQILRVQTTRRTR